MNDPWMHRSTRMSCTSCMWFVVKQRQHVHTLAGHIQDRPMHEDEKFDSPPVIDVGRCRRHSPTMGGYPVVFENDWCGDHKLDENKT